MTRQQRNMGKESDGTPNNSSPLPPVPETGGHLGDGGRQALQDLARTQQAAAKAVGRFRHESDGAEEAIRATSLKLASAIRNIRRRLN